MNEIYIVVRGSYDENMMLCAFADLGDAEQYALEYNAEVPWSHQEDRARVETLPFQD